MRARRWRQRPSSPRLRSAPLLVAALSLLLLLAGCDARAYRIRVIQDNAHASEGVYITAVAQDDDSDARHAAPATSSPATTPPRVYSFRQINASQPELGALNASRNVSQSQPPLSLIAPKADSVDSVAQALSTSADTEPWSPVDPTHAPAKLPNRDAWIPSEATHMPDDADATNGLWRPAAPTEAPDSAYESSDVWSPSDPTRTPRSEITGHEQWHPFDPTMTPNTIDSVLTEVWRPYKPTRTPDAPVVPGDQLWQPSDPTRTPGTDSGLWRPYLPTRTPGVASAGTAAWRPADPTRTPGSSEMLWRPASPTRTPDALEAPDADKVWQPADPTRTPDSVDPDAGLWRPLQPTETPEDDSGGWQPSNPTQTPDDTNDGLWKPSKPTRMPGVGMPLEDRWKPSRPTLTPGTEDSKCWRPSTPTRMPRDSLVTPTSAPTPTPTLPRETTTPHVKKTACLLRCWSPPPTSDASSSTAHERGSVVLAHFGQVLLVLGLSLWWL